MFKFYFYTYLHGFNFILLILFISFNFQKMYSVSKLNTYYDKPIFILIADYGYYINIIIYYGLNNRK